MNTMVWIWCCFLTLTALAPASQAQDSSCLNQLVPCLQYLNSTRPPPHSCCDPLRSVIKSNPRCLCSLLGSKSTTRGAGINMTKADWLASKCGEKVKARSCSSLGPTSGGGWDAKFC